MRRRMMMTAKANTFTFTISGKTYRSESGMTWNDWVGSAYNTDGYTVDVDIVVIIRDGSTYILYYSGILVRPSATVIPFAAYTLEAFTI